MKKAYKVTTVISSLLLTIFFISCGGNKSIKDLNKPVKVSVENIKTGAVPFQYEFPGNGFGLGDKPQ